MRRALAGLKSWIVGELVSQLSPMLGAVAAAAILASFVPSVDEQLRELLALVGAGAVSGSIHDLEGHMGVWVRSNAHQAPWKAYGDGGLNNPGGPNESALDNKREAEAAIRRARWDVDRAFDVGRQTAAQYGATDGAVWIAQVALAQDQVAAPYQQVLNFVPHPLPVGPGLNRALEEWRWGAITPSLIPEIDNWIRGNAGRKLDDLPGKVPPVVVIPDVPVPTVLFPRALVQGIVEQLKRDPTRTLGRIIGWPATPSLGDPSNPARSPQGVLRGPAGAARSSAVAHA